MTPVREFHIASGQRVADYPTPPDDATIRLRLRLIKEEFREVEHDLELLLGANHANADIPTKLRIMADLLKELCDLRYVVEGTAVSLGLPIDEAYAHVHMSNMTKRFPCKHCEGRGSTTHDSCFRDDGTAWGSMTLACWSCKGTGREPLMRKDEGGKVQKGPDYEPADMTKFVALEEGVAELLEES